MPNYVFECEEHGEFDEFISMSEYGDLKKKEGDACYPCHECKTLSKRKYDGVPFGRVGGHSTGGNERSYNYMHGAEENWMKDEVKNIKENVLSQKGQSQGASPYSTYTCDDPLAAGFKKTDSKTAKARMEAAKKVQKAVKTQNKRQKDES